jgi:hypothetical protein
MKWALIKMNKNTIFFEEETYEKSLKFKKWNLFIYENCQVWLLKSL